MWLDQAIQAQFPPGVVLPDELRRLTEFIDFTGFTYGSLMRIGPNGESVLRWFAGGEDAARQFAGFGNEPDGSIVALWLYAGPDASIAPVVYLASEGVGSRVLANNFRDFLALWAVGYKSLAFDLFDKRAAPTSWGGHLRRWLRDELEIVAPKIGGDIVRKGQALHPDLTEWIDDWQKKRFKEPS